MLVFWNALGLILESAVVVAAGKLKRTDFSGWDRLENSPLPLCGADGPRVDVGARKPAVEVA